MNVASHLIINECTSCQMCAAVCSRNAINIRLNEDGFYRPYVDESICTNCGLCTKVCYKYDDDIRVTAIEDTSNIDVYSAQHLSDSLLEKVTSGGVADALAKELIAQGYVCIGVTYNINNHRAEHAIATTEKKRTRLEDQSISSHIALMHLKNLLRICIQPILLYSDCLAISMLLTSI